MIMSRSHSVSFSEQLRCQTDCRVDASLTTTILVTSSPRSTDIYHTIPYNKRKEKKRKKREREREKKKEEKEIEEKENDNLTQ